MAAQFPLFIGPVTVQWGSNNTVFDLTQTLSNSKLET